MQLRCRTWRGDAGSVREDEFAPEIPCVHGRSIGDAKAEEIEDPKHGRVDRAPLQNAEKTNTGKEREKKGPPRGDMRSERLVRDPEGTVCRLSSEVPREEGRGREEDREDEVDEYCTAGTSRGEYGRPYLEEHDGSQEHERKSAQRWMKVHVRCDETSDDVTRLPLMSV
jgi:hypothetical protein